MLEIINKVNNDFRTMGDLFMNDPKFALYMITYMLLVVTAVVSYLIISHQKRVIKDLKISNKKLYNENEWTKKQQYRLGKMIREAKTIKMDDLEKSCEAEAK